MNCRASARGRRVRRGPPHSCPREVDIAARLSVLNARMRLLGVLSLAVMLVGCASGPATIEAEVAAGTVATWGLFGLWAAVLAFGGP